MPKCLNCNNTVKFFVPVYGYKIFYYEGDNLNDVVDEHTEVEADAPVKCGECESQKVEGMLDV